MIQNIELENPETKDKIEELKKHHESTWKPIAFIILMLVCINSAIFFGGRTLLPIAPSYGVLPGLPYEYNGPVSKGLTTIDPAGSLNIGYVFDIYTVKTILKGMLPFWNPYQALGQPLLGNGISAVLYPPNIFNFLLPYAWYDMVYILDWIIAGIFLYLFLHTLQLRMSAALFGAAVLITSGIFQLYLPLREYTAVIAWFPVLLYTVERTIRAPGWRWQHLLLGIAVYCTFTAGQPEAMVISIFFIAFYSIIRLFFLPHGHILKVMKGLLPGIVGGFLLAAPTWWSFLQYGLTAYSNHPEGTTYGLAHLLPNIIPTIFFPYLYGHDNLAPYIGGWIMVLGLFFAITSLYSFARKKKRWFVFLLWVCVILIVAKMWGMPLINDIAKLPLFERIVYPRYASYIFAIMISCLAAYGLEIFTEIQASRWTPWIIGWSIAVIIVWIYGTHTAWSVLQTKPVMSTDVASFIIYGFGGLAWALILPNALWFLNYLRPQQYGLLAFIATLGVLLQSIGYALHGYTLITFGIISVVSLCIFIIVTIVIATIHNIHIGTPLVAGGATIILFVTLAPIIFTDHGLAQRYNPLTEASYIKKLQELQRDNRFRSYSLDGTPQPNFAMPFFFSSLNNVEALMPMESANFMYRYLDNAVSPIWFAGNLSFGRAPERNASTEFFRNKRYFDLVGVRYLVTTTSAEPGIPLYDTEALSSYRQPIPLTTPLEATFTIPTDTLENIQVLLSTYARKNPGTVELAILETESRTILETIKIDGEQLHDNSLQLFHLTPQTGMKGKNITITLSFTPSTPDAMIAAWIYPNEPALGFAFRVLDTPLSKIAKDEHSGVSIWENPTAIERVFLAPNAQRVASQSDAMNALAAISNLTQEVIIENGDEIRQDPTITSPGILRSFHLEPNRVDIEYDAQSAGILTLTDAYAPGWNATINKQPTPVLRVDGTFRGVRIHHPGAYHVVFWYQPPHWHQMLILATLGFFLIFIAHISQYSWAKKIYER